jgi:hypothetical protein
VNVTREIAPAFRKFGRAEALVLRRSSIQGVLDGFHPKVDVQYAFISDDWWATLVLDLGIIEIGGHYGQALLEG